MRKKAWIHQKARDIEKYGTKKAPWVVDWIEPNGKRRSKSFGPGRENKSRAKHYAIELHVQLANGTYEGQRKETWEQFREKYDDLVICKFSALNREAATHALLQFKKFTGIGKMTEISDEIIDRYIIRLTEAKYSPATINKNLRYLKSALRKASRWEFIERVPEINMLRLQEKEKTFVDDEQFRSMYNACEVARSPNIPNVSPIQYWRALLTFAYLTGWRISQILSLTWDNIDLEGGTAFAPADTTKGKRDERIPLHGAVIEHLRPLLASETHEVFQWKSGKRQSYEVFHKIQDKAGLSNCGKDGGYFGFHDLRRGYATANAEHMDLFELQKLMQHRTLETTQGYVSMAGKLKKAINKAHVPDFLTVREPFTSLQEKKATGE